MDRSLDVLYDPLDPAMIQFNPTTLIDGASIVCAGRSVFSKLIMSVSPFPISHCGILVVGYRGKDNYFHCDRRELYAHETRGKKKSGHQKRRKKGRAKNEVWVLEVAKSFYSFEKDSFDGIHLILLSDFIRKYKGHITVQRLNKPLTKQMKNEMCTFMNMEIKRNPKFERIWLEFLFAALKNQNKENENLKYYFCSEWNGKVYQVIGLLPNDVNPASFNPSDFYKTVLLQDYRLIVIRRIRKPRRPGDMSYK